MGGEGVGRGMGGYKGKAVVYNRSVELFFLYEDAEKDKEDVTKKLDLLEQFYLFIF